jgi:hypothetical protein
LVFGTDRGNAASRRDDQGLNPVQAQIKSWVY